MVNASPLIFFSRGGHFELLRSSADRILVPAAVVNEISARAASDPTVMCLHNASWLEIVSDESIPASILSWGLVSLPFSQLR